MNYRWRIIFILTVILIIWGVINFVYIQPKKDLEKKDIVDVTVYYEALCPDSKYFFTHHIYPFYPKVSNYVKLNLVPYGKAETIETDGFITFKCQHEEVECYANKIHACAIDLIHDPLVQLYYVTCMIKNNQDPDFIGKECSEKYNVDFTSIQSCAKGEKGSILLKEHGQKTHALNPEVDFIPTVVFNDSRDLVPLKLILKDFKTALCNLFKTRPSDCDY